MAIGSKIILGAATGQSWYSIQITNAGLYQNGTAYEAFNSANWASYAVTLSDPNTKGRYEASMPLSPASYVDQWFFRRAGGSPAITDAPALGLDPNTYWNGSAFQNDITSINGSASAASSLSFVQNDSSNTLIVNATAMNWGGLYNQSATENLSATTISTSQTFSTASASVTLATSQPFYAPSKAGDQMTLTSLQVASIVNNIWQAGTGSSAFSVIGSIGKLLLNDTVTFAAILTHLQNFTSGTESVATNYALLQNPSANTNFLNTRISNVSLTDTTSTLTTLPVINDTNSAAALALLLNLTVPAQAGTNNQFTAHALALGPTGNEGVGPYVVTQQVTDGTSNIQSVLVGLSINNTNYSALTGADGIATFGLNATGVYLESAAPTIGMYENYTPTTQTISGSTTLSVIVLVPSAPPIPGVGQCIGTLVCVNAHGARESGVTVWFQAANVPNEAEGVDYDNTIFVETSGSFGVISTLFPSGSVPYQHWRGNSSTATGPKTSFTTAANDGDTFNIPDGIGSP